MWMNDYRYFSKSERLQYLSSQKMTTGIPYFGGKSRIGKYLFNSIFNMALTMEDNGDKPLIFIDAFTGGGKMGLSVPYGWFDTIVMNDLNYGVYSYYCCAKDRHRELIDAVDKLIDGMDKRLFYVCLKMRADKSLDQLMAGAMTYVCAALSFNNMLAYDQAEYKPTMGNNSEKVELEKVRNRAHKAIAKVHQKLNSQKYIIENLDYRELMRKYTGQSWKTEGECHEAISSYINSKKNVLWYLDPPYYEYCLSGTAAAPYVDTFKEEDTVEMTNILSGKNTFVGELFYFIKSDYNPKETVKNAEQELSSGKVLSDSKKGVYKTIVEHKDVMLHIFDSIESKPFISFSVGEFDKGAISEGEVSVGDEWVWCKGLPDGYDKLEKYVI